MTKRSVLAIIPARGGSKGVPRKNIRLLAGKPLLAYSIETALAVPSIDRVVVSTDDTEIAEIAISLGAEVPFLRPDGLATDTARIGPSLLHIKNGLFAAEGYAPYAQVIMYPTHPFRKVSVMEGLVRRLLEGYRNVITCKSVQVDGYGHFYENGAALCPLYDHSYPVAGRQYHRTLGLFLGRTLSNRAHRDYVHVVDDEIELIDIDTFTDFYLAEEVVRSGRYDFNS